MLKKSMEKYKNLEGVPDFEAEIYRDKQNRYCICIPVINEGERIQQELKRAMKAKIHKIVDILLCDGGSTDGSMKNVDSLGVNVLLTKKGTGWQGAQLRMGFWFALQRGYDGIITIDGNNKDSIEDVPLFIKALEQGYDFVQGSRFVKGGRAIHTPLMRYWSIRLIHAPIISLTARHWFTDTTNAYRAYSIKYIQEERVQVFRDVFSTYELLAYLSTRASQIKLKVCEIPVTREYPEKGKVPTKISKVKGSFNLMKIILFNAIGRYNP